MKKTFLLVSLAFVLSFAVVMGAWAGTAMERIVKKGELVVGTSGTQPPLSVVNKKGELMGMDVDISRAMAKELGVNVKFAQIPFAELLPALEAGKVDMVLSGMTITGVRNKKVAFAGPYLVTGKGILAVEQRFAALQEAKGLDTPGVTVAALKDSTSEKFVEASIPKAKLVLVGSYDEAIDLLLKGKVDVVVADYLFCSMTAYRQRQKNLAAGAAPLSFEPLGIAMPEDTLLINWTQNFLNSFQGTGELKKLNEKWLNPGAWLDELP